jgi:FkbM family methyltransferase
MEKFFNDVSHCMPSFSPSIIFDVGANVGEFTQNSIKKFPDSDIYCFEPSKSTFDKLKNNFGKVSRVHFHKIALSNIEGELPFTKDYNLCNSLVVKKTSDKTNRSNDKLDIRMRALSGENIETETVKTKTIDSFCQENDISKIDLLKIDTEGFDFEVLQGAKKALKNKDIGFIYTELTFSRDTNKFSNVFQVIEFLWDFDYEVFRIYEQATVDGRLRRANVALTSSTIREYNKHNIWK